MKLFKDGRDLAMVRRSDDRSVYVCFGQAAVA